MAAHTEWMQNVPYPWRWTLQSQLIDGELPDEQKPHKGPSPIDITTENTGTTIKGLPLCINIKLL